MDAYAKALCVTSSQHVGKRCRRCGAEPSWVDISCHVEADGSETFSMHMADRTPAVRCDPQLRSEVPSAGKNRARAEARRPRK